MLQCRNSGIGWLRAGSMDRAGFVDWHGCAGRNEYVRAAEFQPLEIATRTGVKDVLGRDGDNPEGEDHGADVSEALPDGQGMLFDFSPAQQMIDVDEKHLHLARHDLYRPEWPHHPDRREHRAAFDPDHFLTAVRPRAVLEVIAGTAKKYGIARRAPGLAIFGYCSERPNDF